MVTRAARRLRRQLSSGKSRLQQRRGRPRANPSFLFCRYVFRLSVVEHRTPLEGGECVADTLSLFFRLRTGR